MRRRNYKPRPKRGPRAKPLKRSDWPDPQGRHVPLEDVPIAGRRWVMVGSGPISTRYVPVAPGEHVAAVNGGIASVCSDDDPVDLWFVNARSGPVPGWPAYRKALNRKMLATAADRAIDTAVFMVRDETAHKATALILEPQGTRWRDYALLSREARKKVEAAVGFRAERRGKLRLTTRNTACSLGVFVVAYLLEHGAISVRLDGFTFENAYHYLPGEKLEAGARAHVAADIVALPMLQRKFPGKLVDFRIPRPTTRRWWAHAN